MYPGGYQTLTLTGTPTFTSVTASTFYVASGGSIDFGSSDVTITHSANALAFAGAASGYTFTGGPVVPATNDAAALGTSSLMWSDLFLASGAVINFNNGDATIAHSAGLLRLAATYVDTTTPQFAVDGGASGAVLALSTNSTVRGRIRVDGSGNAVVNSTGTGNLYLNADSGAYVVIPTASPASGAAGPAGAVAWDANYLYVCTASGVWKRAALTGGY